MVPVLRLHAYRITDADLTKAWTVMVMGDEGILCQSLCAYDARVTGVISGAGDYEPGILLDRQRASSNHKPLALVGKVYCKEDAQFGIY